LERKQKTWKSNDSKRKLKIDTMIKVGSGKMTNSVKTCWVIPKMGPRFGRNLKKIFTLFFLNIQEILYLP
jgi:hypothetical protein